MSRESMSGDVALEAKQVPAGEPFIAFPAGEMGPIDEIGDSANVTETAKEPTSFFCWQNFLVVLPSLLTATLFGYNIGYVGPYTRIYSYATNCQLYGAQTSCETLSGAKCKWMDATTVNATSTLGMVCGWEAPRTTCFLSYDDEGSCGADHDCVWSYSASTCGNKVGYTSIQSGLFAGSLIMGTAVGSLLGGYLTKWLDYRKSFLLIGVMASIGTILAHVATGIFQYWLLFVSRIIFGFPMGWMSVTAPHYTDKFAPRRYQKPLGTLFQVFTAFGEFVTAFFAICLGNTIAYDAERDAKVMGRLQGLTAPSTLMCILTLLVPLVTKDGYSVSNAKSTAPEDDATAAKPAAKKYPISKMVGPLLIGVAMGCTLQLTGINANMNFAPTIMSNLGLDALVGNIIVMAWNSVTAFVAIPLSKKFTMRTLFLFFTLLGSLCCLFLSGIPVYPGVTKVKLAKEVIGIIGIALFIASYEFGIGPCFFVLSVDVFPESFRPIGSSFTVCVMFIFNLVINICYPIATEGISGGPSGNQDKGQAVAFMFFGCIGIVTVVIEYFFLHPWEEQDADDLNEPGTC
ncbi:putative glucose transporter/membrane transporter D2 [Leptomonas pyrrhocoris]|uniref:Putative glucose transporter/membrane transporter D2 n=1 Tax=Leptomonas pyrrhocoris TaxID=157538 RepID=A0A0N0DT06_LEPPY|nr:putative glucose transporter/membrane transporter D2 [Leptomonas pyrrhocoris]XP_015655249.1 putative glucose transporter/membrane transporter D2 [Leptomonas pyrrhocoris]XP_015655250.1 putative glucose transporter/membrane transporter D2 [Leptomonas pyrrhocoris]XP_015655251.1 putative glucose transporter/membrane transporter D2 [Leptomonas pyrrhocoris]XP_015655252.1 putative glucose transporter/membrane transporter D2 [Leptomonas pyrrhocoris]XP_015655253.1 putative glucose transporter/membra|eukprot:XP_015655248.1 putative glucose transporter/membrane transporter D2 [Leptomonas pyrrhocoris]